MAANGGLTPEAARRLAKLLALLGSDNAHERAAAARKAQELVRGAGLDRGRGRDGAARDQEVLPGDLPRAGAPEGQGCRFRSERARPAPGAGAARPMAAGRRGRGVGAGLRRGRRRLSRRTRHAIRDATLVLLVGGVAALFARLVLPRLLGW